MATVTGYTAARMKAIEDSAVIAGVVVGDVLMLNRYDGSQINAGSVRGPQGVPGYPGDASIQIVTSNTRPTNPFIGMMIYETDTHRLYSWNGTIWTYRGGVILCTSITRPSSPFIGLMIYETDTKTFLAYDGVTWGSVGGGGITVCTSTTRPISPITGTMIYETDTKKIYVYYLSSWNLPKNVAGGVLGRAVVAVNQMGIGTTLTDLTGLSVTITTPGGRWIKISAEGVWDPSTGGAPGGYVVLNNGNVQNQRIANFWNFTVKSGGSVVEPLPAGNHTFKLQMAANTSGTVGLIAGPSYPAYILVEDVGGF